MKLAVEFTAYHVKDNTSLFYSWLIPWRFFFGSNFKILWKMCWLEKPLHKLNTLSFLKNTYHCELHNRPHSLNLENEKAKGLYVEIEREITCTVFSIKIKSIHENRQNLIILCSAEWTIKITSQWTPYKWKCLWVNDS